MTWRIYYADGSVSEGNTKGNWKQAPATDVQAVVSFPMTQPLRWHYSGGPVRDRDLWTGENTYDPLGYGDVKLGSLIFDAEYFAIWDRACGDSLS